MENIPQQPQMPTEPKKSWFSLHHTGTTIVVALAVLIAASAIASWQMPKQSTEPVGNQNKDETVNWQTYRNEQFGFELKYSADLTATEQLKEYFDLEPENPNNETFDFFSLNLSGIDRQAFNFNLFINHPGIGFEGTELLSKTIVTIGGVKAEKQILEVAEGHEKGEKSMLFAFEKGTNEYLIYVTGFSDQADKILSTFKFNPSPNSSVKSFCSNVSSKSFKSKEKYETGLGPNGSLIMGYWTISFDKAGLAQTPQQREVTWFHSDVAETGSYTCSDNLISLKFRGGSSVTASYNDSKNSITFQGIEYLETNN